MSPVIVDGRGVESRFTRDDVVGAVPGILRTGLDADAAELGDCLLGVGESDPIADIAVPNVAAMRAQVERVDPSVGKDSHVGEGAFDQRLHREHVAPIEPNHLPRRAIADLNGFDDFALSELDGADERRVDVELIDCIVIVDILPDPRIRRQRRRHGLRGGNTRRDNQAGKGRRQHLHHHSASSRRCRVSASTR